MNDPTLVKAGHLPEQTRVVLSLFDRENSVGRTGRALYHTLHALNGTRKQGFAGATVFAKLMKVERQAVHRAVKELQTAELLTVHPGGSHVTVIVPELFPQETLLLYSLVSGEKLEGVAASADVAVPLPAPQASAPAKKGGRKKAEAAPPPPPVQQSPVTTPTPPPAPSPNPPVHPIPVPGPQPTPPPVPTTPEQPAPAEQAAAESAAEPAEKVKMNPEVAAWVCSSLENMTDYLCYGPQAMVTKDKHCLRPTPINWRTAMKSDGNADPERWTPNQFMGFYWYRVSRYRATAGLPLTLPGREFGRVGKDISNLLIKLGGKVAMFSFIDTLTAYFDLVRYQIGGQFGMSQVLDETTLSKAQVAGAVLAIHQMDQPTRAQLMQQLYDQQNQQQQPQG